MVETAAATGIQERKSNPSIRMMSLRRATKAIMGEMTKKLKSTREFAKVRSHSLVPNLRGRENEVP